MPLAQSDLTRAAAWNGALRGVDTRTTSLAPVTSGAARMVNLAPMTGQAQFDELTTHVDGETETFRHPAISYVVAIAANTFEDASGALTGRLYGPSHEGMAGTVNDAGRELAPAFGGRRSAN